jgi:tyrosine-protein kinase Etk/Wzc
MAQLDNEKVDLNVAEGPSAGPVEAAPRFPPSFIIVAKRKSFILKFVGASAVLSLIIVFLLPKMYTATTRIMPPQQSQSLSVTALMSQLGPLAALAGQGLGLRTPSDVYVSMLRSDTVANALVDRFSLKSVYKEKLRVDARKTLDSRSQIFAGKDGIISVSVDDRDPLRAAEIANAYTDELEKLTKVLAVSEAAKRRLFFERETKLAMDDLSAAEVSLKQTQEKTGLILLEPQSRVMIEALAGVRARVAAKEVEVQVMRSFAASENPDLLRAENELAAMKVQVAKLEVGGSKPSIADLPIESVPTAGLEYIRKFREVRYREALFELLAKQYEAAKIDEARDTFLVQQLDVALPPERKSWPLRAVIVVASVLLALFVSVLAAIFMEKLEEAGKDPEFTSQFQLFKFYLVHRKVLNSKTTL